MNIKTRKILTLTAGIVVLAITFTLGYWMGNRNNRTNLETPNMLSHQDMEHAFGSINPAAMEASPHASAMQGDPMAMGLSGLVAGLEKKVAANPDNIEQQLLLAQTYKELDSRDKALVLLNKLNKRAPKNAQVKFILAKILMSGDDKQELKQALKLFDEAIKLQPELSSDAKLFQGEINVKLNNTP
jgi:cytochrome c-type biogenesis protein CcmH/NrfG